MLLTQRWCPAYTTSKAQRTYLHCKFLLSSPLHLAVILIIFPLPLLHPVERLLQAFELIIHTMQQVFELLIHTIQLLAVLPRGCGEEGGGARERARARARAQERASEKGREREEQCTLHTLG